MAKNLSDITVLVVEDNTIQRKIIQRMLEKQIGVKVVLLAEDGVIGGKVLAEKLDIDVVITDFNMPNKNGGDFIKDARASRFPGKIIGYSAAEEGVQVSGDNAKDIMIANGADAFFNKKDLNKMSLTTTIQQVLDMGEVAQIPSTACSSSSDDSIKSIPSIEKEAPLSASQSNYSDQAPQLIPNPDDDGKKYSTRYRKHTLDITHSIENISLI